VNLLFSPNPGEPLKPMRSIASSGEISRLMLAIKSALAAQDAVPLLVFDEIDANVGGEIAHAVGARMRELAKRHQVLCITHLPPVAAAATSQFVVMKEVRGGRTFTQLREVSGKARREEIARINVVPSLSRGPREISGQDARWPLRQDGSATSVNAESRWSQPKTAATGSRC
jgi:DNA repair protein RecN (Recombination protein N)